MSTAIWQDVLALAELPRHRDWPQLLWAIRRIARVIEQSVFDEASEYMLASAARDLMQEVEESLRFAGVPVVGGHHPGAEYWEAFVETVQLSLNVLRHGHP